MDKQRNAHMNLEFQAKKQTTTNKRNTKRSIQA